MKITNLNLKKLGSTTFGYVASGIAGGAVVAAIILTPGCAKSHAEDKQPEKTITITDETVETEIVSKEETKEVVETETVEEEVTITELDVVTFNQLVDEVVEANKKVDFNLRREDLELAVYINNIEIATPELVDAIESRYNYNEEEMINTYLQTITAYDNDKLQYYNGKDSKYADLSLTVTDPIDKATIKTVDQLTDGLYAQVTGKENKELTLDRFNTLVSDVMKRSDELEIGLKKEEVEIAAYVRNEKYATKEVTDYVNSIKLAKDETFGEIDYRVLCLCNDYNKKNKLKDTSDKYFQDSMFKFKSYSVKEVVDTFENYTREFGTINGYTKDSLTVGGLFTVKLQIDDSLSYFATTGYAAQYQSNIDGIMDANIETVVSRTYAVLGSKAAIKDCEDEKTLTKVSE